MKKMSAFVQAMQDITQQDLEIMRLKAYIEGLESKIAKLEEDLNFFTDMEFRNSPDRI